MNSDPIWILDKLCLWFAIAEIAFDSDIGGTIGSESVILLRCILYGFELDDSSVQLKSRGT